MSKQTAALLLAMGAFAVWYLWQTGALGSTSSATPTSTNGAGTGAGITDPDPLDPIPGVGIL